MQRMRAINPLVSGLLAVMLTGCASSVSPPSTSTSATSLRPPAGSPLAACVDPAPTAPKPIDTSIARNFTADRVMTTISLDSGRFRAAPAPADAHPRISAGLALCNLLAATTVQNFSVLDAAAAHGLSFGLGVLTVSNSLLKTGPHTYTVGSQQRVASLTAYHARLAWLIVIRPDVMASCPAQLSTSSANPARPLPVLPGYQIVAIDADTGAHGVLYTARTNSLCGRRGYRPPSVVPSAEVTSVPWTLVKRGPGPQSATISYPQRPCDLPLATTYARTGLPVVSPDRHNPSLVGVYLDRVVTTCGVATMVKVLLRSATVTTNLPQHLLHAPVGAQDVPI
jgi:hypothetical protein